MNTSSTALRAYALLALLGGSVSPVFAADPVVAVFSRTMNGYARTVLPDNSYKPETYAFADGGRLSANIKDASLDQITFAQVAGVVAASLKRHAYINTSDVNHADLLIFVSYGSTTGVDEESYRNATGSLSADFHTMSNPSTVSGNPNGLGSINRGGPIGPGPLGPGIAVGLGLSAGGAIDIDMELRLDAAAAMDSSLNRIAMANQDRDQVNRFNAEILGYGETLSDTNFLRPYSNTARDVLREVEESRYFVVLKAYDFQRLRNHQGKRLLWELRYSIPRGGNRFDEQLVGMTRFASQFSGQDVNRLVRRPLKEGRIEIGTPVVVPTSAK